MYKILIVEDEPSMQQGIRDNLEIEGYQVEVAGNGTIGLNMLLANNYSLAILDIMLPEISGFDVCKNARKGGIQTPILMLTAKAEEIDKVRGLEYGADDYLTKPFSLRELLARIKAILRRSNNFAPSNTILDNTFEIGQLLVDFSKYTASQNGVEVKLSHKEFELLSYLWQKRNAIVSRNQLLNHVWECNSQITSRTIDNFIVKLRQKIEENPSEPRIIITVHGTGYKLVN